ncbi:hypothetical protein HAX54_049222 [Datura stramonium]|uniref:Uncharacterized protein n=1 Tax=Datura stramonium TaxID=4076 RepID=A0ABS8RR26_DATST|nr:hypothetical protein [Datura stramonium]
MLELGEASTAFRLTDEKAAATRKMRKRLLNVQVLTVDGISGQNSKSNLHHSVGSSIVGLSVELAKKKRGRPRKTPVAQIPSGVNCADPDVGGINDAASSENPSKKGCERPPGSGKQQQREALEPGNLSRPFLEGFSEEATPLMPPTLGSAEFTTKGI